MSDRILAFVDESGQPSQSKASSDHFIMGAVLFRESRLPEVDLWLSAARALTNRQPHHELHWNRIQHPHQRLLLTQAMGAQQWGRFISVVACKRHLPAASHLDDDGAYLYTLRFLAERLSWFGQQHVMPVHLTLAHKVRFKHEKLKDYDRRLRGTSNCQVRWDHLDLGAADLDQPKRNPYLQIADLVASSTGSAFEPDPNNGLMHPEYVQNYAPRIWRGPYRNSQVTSYGLKMHPWRDTTTKAAYPWVATLKASG